jgi:hypothetical protein
LNLTNDGKFGTGVNDGIHDDSLQIDGSPASSLGQADGGAY